MLLILVGLHQNAGREELLAEIPVVQFYAEDRLQKVLELAHGEFLRKSF